MSDDEERWIGPGCWLVMAWTAATLIVVYLIWRNL